MEHALWTCSAMEDKRKELYDKYGKKEIDKLPKASRICGLIPDEMKLDEIFSQIATGNEEENTAVPRPPQEEEEDKMSEDSEGYLIVAGDGACPGGGNVDNRLTRSGSGLYYGKTTATT